VVRSHYAYYCPDGGQNRFLKGELRRGGLLETNRDRRQIGEGG
jgi:hypothetical protein